MVGLLINTVPVRATITAATTTADLLDQLHQANNHTLEHQHLALTEIHRVTGHDQLFDTLFVYENYPIDPARCSATDGLAITEYHRPRKQPLSADAAGHARRRTGPARRIRHRRVRRDSIETLIGRLQRVLVAMTTDPARRLSSMDAAGRRRTRPPG